MKVPMNFHRIAEVKDGNMEVSLYAALECSKRGQNAEKQILDRYCRKKEPLGHRRLGATGLLGLAVVLFAIPSKAQAPAGTASWTYKANLSVQHTGPASAALGGLAYAAGGWNSNYLCSYLNTVEAYNPATNQWSTVAPMPTAREHAGRRSGAESCTWWEAVSAAARAQAQMKCTTRPRTAGHRSRPCLRRGPGTPST